MMGQTLAQKLLARAAGRADVAAGEIVTCRVDLAMMHDSSGPRRVKPMLEKLGAKVWDPDKVVLVTDHYVPAHDDDSRRIVQIARDWARDEGVARFHDMEGICHVVVPQKGYLRPGMFAVGGDSHSSTGGAFGAYMFGIGATEMLGVLVTGEIWVRVPQTIRMRWNGRLGAGVSAKDMMLRMCTQFGMDGGQYQAVEYAGDAVTALSMQERMTLSNMTAELGAQVGLIAPDAVTRDWLLAAGAPAEAIDIDGWQSDADAVCLAEHDFDASTLAPQVSRPHTPADADDVDAFGGVGIDIAYIGACTGAKLDDLRMAAAVLRGKRVARGTRLLVAPASAADQQRAAQDGTLAALTDAGAELLPNACGACAGYGEHRFGEDTVVISATARNFKGRMGAASSQVYLGSPYTVAASAVAGRIADPREVLA
ncbi:MULTISPECIES: 3-isopropylmalate dehydratase large subunit [unclassified Cupriavidus]|uniref:3-isopropylmalate dehydratase large subunit n=1 Tax=unclassified Cupriavidus TaxID=2640874 RepID=UPI001C008F35|nr:MULTISPECIES: 3-isopropylmalate dehydratase large subunit [unclassified Cupriavidus]MCA3188673.1 3-isopropylmalate dehydratase large subunit [Cupriavidus sp.]MCA3199689.1 3-isopropylmalate dehydratase large subunit [Cupriavidus sp.]MCA3205163.1 3-isopropylmalate dehydratase large subunit [Cupriavidus sp.]MCA3206705.1 3-isopropylmalate dehydratase large subunit [Cupriavidus sp.]MCA3232367.1 3-isopropylmalate dehydratase large subunit [Cupriavidus sp.]